MLVAICLARYTRKTAIATHTSMVIAKCGKTWSSGYAEVTMMVAENRGEPSDTDAPKISQYLIKVALPTHSDKHATVRMNPRTRTNKLAEMEMTNKQPKNRQPTDAVIEEMRNPLTTQVKETFMLIHT